MRKALIQVHGRQLKSCEAPVSANVFVNESEEAPLAEAGTCRHGIAESDDLMWHPLQSCAVQCIDSSARGAFQW